MLTHAKTDGFQLPPPPDRDLASFSADTSLEQAALRVAVIGESHSTFWWGYNSINRPSTPSFRNISVFHVSGATAFKSSKILLNIEIDDFVAQSRPDLIVMSFGEIDCRAHVVKQAHLSGCSIAAAVENVVSSYVATVQGVLSKFGKPIICWAPPPSSPPEHFMFNAKFPTAGSALERNYATRAFIERLREHFDGSKRVAVASIFEKLISTSGEAKPDSLFDGCHVSQSYMPDAIDAVKAAAAKLGFSDIDSAFERNWPISETPSMKDVSNGAVVTYSSLSPDRRSPKPGAQWSHMVGFASRPAAGEWLLMDLKAGYLIDRIEITPSKDASGLGGIVVEGSLDGKTFAPIDAAGAPRSAPDRSRPVTRYVRITSTSGDGVDFADVRIMAPSFDQKFRD